MAFRQWFFDFFFDTPEVTKIVLPKVTQNLYCSCWPRELNHEGFPRNIQYRARPKGPSFQFFFGIARLFSEKIPPKGPLFIFLEFRDKMNVDKSQSVPPFSFFGIVRLFSKKFWVL